MMMERLNIWIDGVEKMEQTRYSVNAEKAAESERIGDYDCACAYWAYAESGAKKPADKKWAHCRLVYCQKMVVLCPEK